MFAALLLVLQLNSNISIFSTVGSLPEDPLPVTWQEEPEDDPEDLQDENVSYDDVDAEPENDLHDEGDLEDQEDYSFDDVIDPEDKPDDMQPSEQTPVAGKEDKQQFRETIYQTVYVTEAASSETVTYDDYYSDTYYLISVICSILLFFFIVCICKYIYKFLDMFF